MVDRKLLVLALLLSLIVLARVNPSLTSLRSAEASSISYYLNREYVKVWVNRDGTIDLIYSIEIVCTQGEIRFVKVGQPNGDFTIGEAFDENGNVLRATDVSEGEYYAVRVDLHSPLKAGRMVVFTLTMNVGHMIWEDEENPENVGMLLTPCWWEANVKELRVTVVLPEGVTEQGVKCVPNWDNAYNDVEEDGRLVVYWERRNLQPNEKFSFGVFFPREFVEHYKVKGRSLDWQTVGYTLLGGVAATVGLGSVVYAFRKRRYIKPALFMETLGVRRGLTAVEASYILDFPPNKIVTEILYGLLMKKAVWVAEATPVLKLKVMEDFKDGASLHYYERIFLKALKVDGTLDEEKLAETIMLLRESVEEKLRGYCRRDTINYYRKVTAEAWKHVEKAGTPELASKA